MQMSLNAYEKPELLHYRPSYLILGESVSECGDGIVDDTDPECDGMFIPV